MRSLRSVTPRMQHAGEKKICSSRSRLTKLNQCKCRAPFRVKQRLVSWQAGPASQLDPHPRPRDIPKRSCVSGGGYACVFFFEGAVGYACKCQWCECSVSRRPAQLARALSLAVTNSRTRDLRSAESPLFSVSLRSFFFR
uniref:Uncharacterized protein n=2 Tax=Aegilops tauschii subsp. strangulata TaxID=200361 RepID=A0A453JYI0_AEGTS